jgi:hypothetical protein
MGAWLVIVRIQGRANILALPVVNSYDIVNLVVTLLVFCWLKPVLIFCSFLKYRYNIHLADNFANGVT